MDANLADNGGEAESGRLVLFFILFSLSLGYVIWPTVKDWQHPNFFFLKIKKNQINKPYLRCTNSIHQRT